LNIRKYFSWDEPYHQVNREERYYCAILFHLLLINGNLPRFLRMIGINHDRVDDCAVYVEYSQLRDIWHKQQDNEKKRKYILNTLGYKTDHRLHTSSIECFNRYFGAVPHPSRNYIQSPGNWSISRFHDNIVDNDQFLKTSKFKWCFNAKPDIVIHLCDDKAVCIEAKFKSREGLYPSSRQDKKIFNQRGLDYVKQRDIQTMIFYLLGIECNFVFLTASKVDGDCNNITWTDIFAILNLKGVPSSVEESVNTISESCHQNA